MPNGLGKLQARAAARFPRSAAFYRRYHTTITAIGIIIFVAAVAYIGISQHHTEGETSKVAKQVNVITKNSPCTPSAGPGSPPVHPKQCAENYATGFKTLTPLQSCEFLQKGAGLISIGGQPIPPVTCNVPQAVQESREAGKAGKNGKLDNKSGSESRNLPSEGAGSPTAPSEATKGSPASESPAAQTPGKSEQPKHESTPKHEQKPSQGSEPSSGGSPTQSGGGTSPAGSPEASTGTGSTGSGASEGGGAIGVEGSPPVVTTGGLEEVVGGVGHTVEEATKPLCEVGLAGIKVCLR